MSMADLKKDTYADANAKKTTSSTSSSTSSTTTSSVVDEDAATWNFLKSVGFTDAGAAGLMGNLYAESGLKSNKVEKASLMLNPPSYQGHTYAKDYGINYDDVTYTAAVDKGLKEGVKGSAETNLNPKFGIIPEYEFVYMPWRVKNNTKFGQNGYGLVQWTSPGRKQALYNYIKSKGVSISDKKSQLEYLVNELKTTSDYRNVYSTLTSSNNLQSASDIVLKEFEQPSNAASKSAERLKFSQKYYDKYSNNPVANATFADGTTIDSTGGTGGVNISFPTYNLNENQLKGVANILQHEQSGIRGRYAEASLMANLLDAKDESRANASALEDYLTKPPGKNWFAYGRDRYNAGKAGNVKIEDTALKAAIDIFNNGKRTMPRYINEHDCFSDIVSTNPAIDKKDRSAYVPNVTKVLNKYAAKSANPVPWTFYSFPDDKADPFGYTSEELRSKWGEAHYDIDENGNLSVPSGFTEGASGATGFANDNSSANGGTDFWSTISNIFSTVLNKAFGTMGKVGDALSSLFGFNTVTTTNTSANTEGFANSATTGQVGVSSVAATSGSMVNGFPYYMQSDPQWGSHPYGNHGTLSSSACGPTSMAMVMKSYGENVTPVETADWSAQHGYREKSGTGWGFFKAIGNTAGLTVNQFDPDVNRVKQDIQNGIPVIGSMRPGNFTKKGHFVVFTGMDSAGHIYVNDPSNSTRTSHSWEASQSLGQAKQFWEISKNGKGSLGQITVTAPSLAGAAGGSSGLYDFYGGSSIRYATQGKGDTEHTVQYSTYMNDFPYYMQRDNEWRNKPYGWHGVLDDAACGPSSMSMVMNSYGYPATPLSMANWSGEHGYRDENGTKWAFFKALGDEVGLDVKEFAPDIERVKQDIQNGIPVICSMRPGNFTQFGHFVVITGIDKNGNVYINDPYNLTRTSHPWTVEESLAQGKRFWEISKNGKGSLKKITKIGTPSLAGSAHGSGSGLYGFYGGASQRSAMQGSNKNLYKVGYNTTYNGFPYYMQRDVEWRNEPYGWHGVLDDAACGPSSMSMVMNSYGYPATPLTMANWSAEHGYRAESGTDWDFFKALGDEVGLTVKQFDPDINRVKEDIKNGIPVICSMSPGNFTTQGHFVVITGIDDKGNVYINDPYNLTRTMHPWLESESIAQGKQFWEISKDGKGSLGKIIKGSPSLAGSASASVNYDSGGASGLYRLYGGATNSSNRYNIDPLIMADISRQSDLSSDYSMTTSKPKDHSIDYSAPNAVVTANTSKKKSQYLGVSDLNRSLYANKNAWNRSSANFHTLDTDMSSLYAWNKKKASKKKKYKKYSTSASVSAINNNIADNNAIISEKLDALIAVTSGLISKCRSKMGPNADIIISNAKANVSLSSDETISQKLTNLNNIASGIINNTNVTGPGGITTSSNVYIPKKKVRKIVRGGSSGLVGINSIYNFIGGDSGLDITSATTEIDKLIVNIDALSKLIIPGGLTGPNNILAKYIDPSNTNAPTVTANNSESIEDKIKKLAINIDILSKIYIPNNNITGGASGIPSLDRQLDRGASNRRNTLNKPFNDFKTTSKKVEEEKKKKQAIDIANRAKASMSHEADNEAIRKMMNENYKITRAAASHEADNEAIRNMMNNNYYSAAMDKELSDLKNTPDAGRHDALWWEREQAALRNDPSAGRELVMWGKEQTAMKKDPSAGRNKNLANGSSSSGSSGSSYSGSTSGSAGYGGGGISPEIASGILEYLKIIAENTTNNASIKTIVEILTSLTKIIGATNQASVQEQSNVTQSNAEDDARREKIQSELNTVMSQLRQIAQSA